jgi:cobalt/nickel transport system permease protein
VSQTRFLDKTLFALARLADQSLLSEAFAGRKGFLQSLDVRVKLLTFLAILVLISVSRRLETICLLYAAGLLLAFLSNVPLGFFLRRVWLFVPLFSAAIVLPSVLNIITPGQPVFIIASLGREHGWWRYTIPSEIAVTREGITAASFVIARVASSVSFAVLFTLTTKWSRVFPALRALAVPPVFVVTLSMTYRYLFVFIRMIEDMYLARKSRTIVPLTPGADRNWTASRIGITFRKSADMGHDIYRAMISRGFQGEFPGINRFHARAGDYIWAATVLLAGCILVGFERGIIG